MKYYAVAELTITDASWIPEYVENVTPLVKKYGGKYLSRGPKVEKIEGQENAPHIALIVEFENREAAEAFYQSDEYKPYLEKRIAGSNSRFLLLPGEDSAVA